MNNNEIEYFVVWWIYSRNYKGIAELKTNFLEAQKTFKSWESTQQIGSGNIEYFESKTDAIDFINWVKQGGE